MPSLIKKLKAYWFYIRYRHAVGCLSLCLKPSG